MQCQGLDRRRRGGQENAAVGPPIALDNAYNLARDGLFCRRVRLRSVRELPLNYGLRRVTLDDVCSGINSFFSYRMTC